MFVPSEGVEHRRLGLVAAVADPLDAVEKEHRSERLVRLDAEALPLGCTREQLTKEFHRREPHARPVEGAAILHRRQLAVVLWEWWWGVRGVPVRAREVRAARGGVRVFEPSSSRGDARQQG